MAKNGSLIKQRVRALCLVYDVITGTKKKELHKTEIGNKKLLSCKSSCSRYKLALVENQKARNGSENDRKRQMITEGFENVKRRLMEVQSCIPMLNKDIGDCC